MGGMFGKTRNNNTKWHRGIDLLNPYGAPIFAMYDGFIYSSKYDPKGAGYYTRIQSTVNGETFIHVYAHLQKNNRIEQGPSRSPMVYVQAGDIIGHQGDSGNLKNAIADDAVESHVHIEVRKHDGSNSWGFDNFEPVDPKDYLSTTIDSNGNSQSNTDCN